jgi:gliding motility-associated lipoprotein GldD
MLFEIKRNTTSFFMGIFAVYFAAVSCTDTVATPKPTAYPKVDLPTQKYTPINSTCAYNFEMSGAAQLIPTPQRLALPEALPCWYNVTYADQQATIYLSYKPLRTAADLVRATEDAHKLTFKHTVKASAIEENFINKKDKKVFGVLYDVRGNAASPIQFFVTDSSRHYLRGALYFNASPNADSIAPVVEYFRQDILHLIDTFSWQ